MVEPWISYMSFTDETNPEMCDLTGRGHVHTNSAFDWTFLKVRV
jgi:hypothetical protein